jgi:hypothetical protein
MSKKYKYTAVAGTAGSLFTRMAFDEVNNTTEFAKNILDFVHDKISEQDYAQLKKMLMGGEEDADAPIRGAEARGAQDSRMSRSEEKRFDELFPSARRIGADPKYSFR